MASGRAGRWNREGEQMIYTANSIALACLENLVHRSGASLLADFTVLTLFVPPGTGCHTIRENKLVDGWENKAGITRTLGSQWLKKNETLLCKVPSAIIQQEFNYLVNPFHPDFKELRIVYRQAFNFDKRLKNET